MHLRRAVLLMAVILVSVALVQAVVPAPRRPAAPEQPVVAPAPAAGPVARTISLHFPAPERAPAPTKLAPGAHVVVQVSTTAAGEATVPGLGLVQTAEPGTPARFDVLVPRPGSYDITFDPISGSPVRVGRLVVG